MPHDRADRWEQQDLIRRTLQALDIAARTIRAAIGDDRSTDSSLTSQISDRGPDGPRSEIRPLILEKVLAEAAMLLRCVAPISALDTRLHDAIDHVARLLVPHARGEKLLAALCREPGLALDHAITHIQLRDLGYPDAHVDRLLAEILQTGAVGGPERLPHREMEQRWLNRIWSGTGSAAPADGDLLARSSLGRPLDALGSATDDIYAFTHVVLYASDMGRRTVRLPRPIGEITADAEAALSASVDADNFDLTAELLWTWPMLGVPWSPAAAFSFAILAATQDAHGFLPGPGFSSAQHDGLPDGQREEYVLKTSYHATLVMGLLCSAALRSGLAPPVTVAAADRPVGAADSVYTLVRNQPREPLWQQAFQQLEVCRREPLAPFVLAAALRRARDSSDLGLLRECLRVGLRLGLLDRPAPLQAVALLRRATLLGQRSIVEAGGRSQLATAGHPPPLWADSAA